MFIAHLPTAYLAFKVAPAMPRPLWIAGLAGSVAPDLDLLWFYFVDQRAHHHHDYLTHRPIFWLSILGMGLIMHHFGKSKFGTGIGLFSIGALIHMVLDTIAGKIGWLWPYSDAAAPFVVVPASHNNWILSFRVMPKSW